MSKIFINGNNKNRGIGESKIRTQGGYKSGKEKI